MALSASWTAIWTMAWTRDCCCGPPKRGATVSAIAFQSVTTSALAGPGRVTADRSASASAHARHSVATRRPPARRMFRTTSRCRKRGGGAAKPRATRPSALGFGASRGNHQESSWSDLLRWRGRPRGPIPRPRGAPPSDSDDHRTTSRARPRRTRTPDAKTGPVRTGVLGRATGLGGRIIEEPLIPARLLLPSCWVRRLRVGQE